MLLKTVHIRKFKCVRDSGVFGIDSDVTCLVGKNESGKTAILEALEKINPLDDAKRSFDDLEYPRSELTEYRNRDKTKPVHAITTTWEVESDDMTAIEDLLGEGVLQGKVITLRKGYDTDPDWQFECDESKGLANLLSTSSLFEEEKAPYATLATIADAFKHLANKAAPAEPNIEGMRSPREQVLFKHIEDNFGGDEPSCRQTLVALFEGQLPKMVYFDDYLRMPGEVSLQDLKTRPKAKDEPPNRVFAALLAMVGRSNEDLETIGEFERLQAELEGASNALTKEIFRYWTQNRHLRVQFRFEQGLAKDPPPFNSGFVMRTRIENTRHGVTTRFDDRSAGFVWFFSFLVWFSQVRKNYGDNLIILLDEPGLSLHAKAQADLLRYFDERLGEFQVIYTTHSPFMVDAARILRARTVEDVFKEATDSTMTEQDVGTIVGHDVLSTDRDTLFPLQAALGYDITQSLFIGEHSLLVEGPSELLYFPWFSRRLASLNRTALDPRWTLTPCGGIDKVCSFLSLFAGQRLHIATFVDFADGAKRRVRELRENELLRSGHVLSADQYAGQAEADTEDVIGRRAYVDIVNKCYGLVGPTALLDTKPNGASMRVVKEVEEHFRTNATQGPEFNHYRPSEYLMQNGITFEFAGLNEALDRFERLFTDLNKLLS